jgi:putative membrane protein
MRSFITHWFVLTLALAATAWILPGVEVESVSALFVAAALLGFLNAVLKPILVVLTLPITVVTLGIFYFVLNALLFGLASKLVDGFVVHGFGAAFLGALLMSVLSWGIGSLVKGRARTDGA